MFKFSGKRVSRLVGLPLLVAVALLVTVFSSSTAFAARSLCRTDPTVVLSDGTVLNLSAIVATDVSNINNVLYVIHAPTGVKATAIVYSDIVPKISERLIVVSDSAPRTYSTDTTVFLKDKATLPMEAMSTKGLVIATTPGFTGQPVTVRLGTGSLLK